MRTSEGASGSDAAVAEDPAATRAGAFLSIDLAAVRANYTRLRNELSGAACGAAVKADAYGLGIERVGPALAEAGARHFFVALLDEGIVLRRVLAETAPDAMIAVLNGPIPGCEQDFHAHGLVPVLNSLGDIALWRAFARRRGERLPAILHLDSGMCRLGLPPQELDLLAADHGLLEGLELLYIMSHLASAEDPQAAINRTQLASFRAALPRLPAAGASLANSSGIFLGPAFHFDLARPGVALYGINPQPGHPNQMSQVVRLQGKILQVRDVDAPQTVGYGASHRVEGPGRIATVAVGYADGYPRSLSGYGRAVLDGHDVAVVGRVSMDLITLDVSPVARDVAVPGALVDMIGPNNDLDDMAERAGTIGYELLTSLGRRYHRVYRDA